MIINKYCVVLILIILCSTAEAQKLKITSPTQGEKWIVDKMYNISWEAYNLSGSVIIEYKENKYWASYNKLKEVPLGEGETPFYVKNNFGDVIKIRIKSMERPSISDEVTVNISDSNSQPDTKKRSTTQSTSGNYLLIIKNDNIREGAYQTYDRIKYCKYNERYEIIGKEGDWFKIKLDLYPYYGYTYYDNGVEVTQEQLDRGISAEDYVPSPATSYPSTVHPKLTGNYFNLFNGSGYIGYSSKFTYGYVLSGPLLKLGPLLIGTGSKSTDYHSTYRVGLTFFNSNTSNELWYYYLMFEDFINQDNKKHHIIDIGFYGGGKFLFNFFNGYEKFGYRHQFANGKVFDEIINSSLSGFYYETGFFLGNMW